MNTARAPIGASDDMPFIDTTQYLNAWNMLNISYLSRELCLSNNEYLSELHPETTAKITPLCASIRPTKKPFTERVRRSVVLSGRTLAGLQRVIVVYSPGVAYVVSTTRENSRSIPAVGPGKER